MPDSFHRPADLTAAGRRARPRPVMTAVAAPPQTLYFEDLHVGQSWHSPMRRITADDVRAFAELTGDDDPLHQCDGSDGADSDGADAADPDTTSRRGDFVRSPFGRPVAHGLLGLSVLAGLGVDHPRAATLALVGLQDWQFMRPLFFDQRVRVETIVEELTPHGRRAGRVTWLRKLLDETGTLLQQGRFVTLVSTRSPNPRRPR